MMLLLCMASDCGLGGQCAQTAAGLAQQKSTLFAPGDYLEAIPGYIRLAPRLRLNTLPVNEKMSSQTTDQTCLKCGKKRGSQSGGEEDVCSCSNLLAAAAWPNLGKREGGDSVDRTAKFLRLKELGTGTIFLPASTEPGPMLPITIDLAPGAIIGGVYQIIDLIGRGGMGEVYSALHIPLDKKCALKVIPPSEVTDVAWQRFQLEAKIVSKLEHVNLVRVTDLGLHEECLPYYAMEYLEGKNLAEVIADEGPLELSRTLEIFMQVCGGVECAHQGGVLHRDVKPANIMLTYSPSGKMEVKILDFGLAKLIRHDRYKQSLTGSGDVFGSPCYMSPEQCGDEEVDSRSDIYSLGCTLFEALTGRPPFSGNLAAAVFFGHLEAQPPTLADAHGKKKFPQSMEELMSRLLRKNPNDRYQTLAEVKADLERILAIESGQSPPQASDGAQADGGILQVAGISLPLPKTSPRLWLAMAAAAVTGLIGAASYHYFYQPPLDVSLSTKISPGPAAAQAVTGNTSAEAVASAPALPTATAAGIAAGQAAAAPDHEELHLKPFYQGIVSREGKTCQHWQYLGHRPAPLFLVYNDSKEQIEAGLAGDLYIPVGSSVCAMPKQALVRKPPLTTGLRGAVLDEVDYEWYSWPDVQAANGAFAQCQSIKGLRIGNFSWSRGDTTASIAAINQFTNLERLILDACYDGESLSRISRLKALTELRLNSGRIRLHDCLRQIGGSKNLTFLSVFSWSIHSSDLDLLSRCTHIRRLMIGQLTGSREQLAMLSELPLLWRLELPALHFRPDLSADLKQIKSLKILKLFQSGDWTEGQISQLRQDLPGVEIITYKSVAELREAFWLP